MDHPTPHHNLFYSRLKRAVLSRPRLVRSFMYLIFSFVLIIGGLKLLNWFMPWQSLHHVTQYVDAFIDPREVLDQTDGRTNILLLGIGGGDHSGASLTDSIMMISLDIESGDIVVLPLPRDIWVPSMKAKLNTAYYYGSQKTPNGGLILAKSSVSELTGQPIHYVALVDFSGFIRVIDQLGGLEVNVQNGFTDNRFPIPGKENVYPIEDRYETISFQPGLQHMDGTTTLKYVRSRNAVGPEGTDIARTARQQQVIKALRNKAFTTQLIFHPEQIMALYDTVADAVSTDLNQEQIAALARVATKVDNDQIRASTIPTYLGTGYEEIDSEAAILAYPGDRTAYDDQYVLIPQNNNYAMLEIYVSCVIDPTCHSQYQLQNE